MYDLLIANAEPIVTPEVVWSGFAPMLILMVGALVMILLVSLAGGRLPRGSYATYSVVVAAAAALATIPLWHRVADEGPQSLVAGAVGLDGFSLFVTWVVCASVILGSLLADGYLRREGLEGPEFYVLLLLAASGAVVMASANDLIVLFVGLEILSVAVYVLAASHNRRVSSQESGFKYFVLGAFASAFLLYGIALIYGATGSTGLADIRAFLAQNALRSNALLLGGLALLLVGFGFKISAAPFHFWTPDVYQGAPTPVAAFMASGVKAGAVAALLRVFVTTFGPSSVDLWRPMVIGIAVLSLIVGSVLAAVQTNVKRMLAYSSINHVGFILLGVVAANDQGTSAVLFYLAAYALMVIGSFGVVTLVGRRNDGLHSIEDYKGLGRTRPGLALAFSIFLFAQAGVPLTGGFFAKLGVIAAAVESGRQWLAVVAMLAAVIAAFLYLRIVGAMWFAGDPDHGDEVQLAGPPVRFPVGGVMAIGLALTGTLLLGVLPGLLSGPAADAVARLVATGG